MTRMTRFPNDAVSWMPPEQPLARPIQSFARPHRDAAAPGWRPARATGLWRLATFGPAVALTVAVIRTFGAWLQDGGLTGLEMLLIALVSLTFFWVALGFATALVGLVRLALSRALAAPSGGRQTPLTVALLVPVHEEVPEDVLGNAEAMMEDLAASGTAHRFTLFVLSDSRGHDIAEREMQAMALLKARLPAGMEAHYRRRRRNHERKTGNIGDWVRRWGGGWEAMVVLDADSLMSAEALTALADELAADPSAGLIQSAPRLIGARTLFGRIQQFAASIYGGPFSEGLAAWSDREGNFWGHNAILRTAAFASCAALPRMPALRGKGGLIMSHDFVEAGLMRRAGWAVRFMPGIAGSYEEPPATLIDYVVRDRRWCHGNLQHLALLLAAGFHPVSRFHMLHGAMGYLLSPLWFALLVIWVLVGNGEQSLVLYFSETNPLYPVWPEMSGRDGLLILLFMYGILLAPKFMGVLALPLTGIAVSRLGGPVRFALSLVSEIVASILLAPIMMIQQLVAVLRVAVGVKASWKPQARSGGHYPLRTVARFHALETVIGIGLAVGMAAGWVSFWLAPIAVSLALSVPISLLSRVDLEAARLTRRYLGTPELFDEPRILSLARARRGEMGRALDASKVGPTMAAQ